jgi:hypothetical protein
MPLRGHVKVNLQAGSSNPIMSVRGHVKVNLQAGSSNPIMSVRGHVKVNIFRLVHQIPSCPYGDM